MYAIALGELCEASAAIELARVFKCAPPEEVSQALAFAVRFKNILSRLIH